jgi:GT2 family glycosyltransferase
MTDQYPAVAVVLLNWNGKQFLEKFLPSVCASAYPNLAVYLADNDSGDDSVDFVRKAYPSVKVILNGVNAGFAAGYNMALEKIRADYYVLLNQDVEVTPGWIAPVIRLMESDQAIAACQPKILSYRQKGHFEYAGASGGFIDRFGFPFCRGRIFDTVEEDRGQYDTPRQVFWATGAALFIRAELYHRAGGLDPYFFAHMEEIDLCWRLQRMGYAVWCCPQSTVYHVGGGSLAQGSPRKMFLNFRNNLIMMHKNMHGWERFAALFIRLMLDGMAACRSIVMGYPSEIKAILKAHFAYYRWLFGAKRSDHTSKIKHIAICKINRLSGIYPRSIAWQYFVRRHKTFYILYKHLQKMEM